MIEGMLAEPMVTVVSLFTTFLIGRAVALAETLFSRSYPSTTCSGPGLDSCVDAQSSYTERVAEASR